MSYQLVIAEKPSVAQSIAKILGVTNRKDGYLEGNGYLISWCICLHAENQPGSEGTVVLYDRLHPESDGASRHWFYPSDNGPFLWSFCLDGCSVSNSDHSPLGRIYY